MSEKRFCECCGRLIIPGREVWLEFDQRTNLYTDQPVPLEHSQGGFHFGKRCAKRILNRQSRHDPR